MPKMLCLDLDGTLLMPDLTIPQPVISALRELISRGVVVTLATGRMFPSAKKYADLIGLTAPLVVYNGAVVRAAAASEPLYSFPVPLDLMRSVIELASAGGWYLQLYNNDKIVVAEKSRHTEADPDFQNAPCVQVGDLRYASLGPTPKLMTRDEPDEIARRRAALQSRLGEQLHLAASSPRLLEMMDKDVTKARSLDRLCRSLGLTPDDAVACGDSDNDTEMLCWAGVGCCMHNGLASVKEQCGYVCRNANSHGVLEVIERFF